MSINIYVGNLSFNSNEDEVRQLFEAYGSVESVKVITDQFTGRSKGFGFVEMTNREEGLEAIKQLDSTELGGRNLKVNEAKPKREASRGGGRDNRRSRW
jgi:RNA recognition motif-containing protein